MQIRYGTLREWVISGQTSTLLGQRWNIQSYNWFTLPVWRGSSKAGACGCAAPQLLVQPIQAGADIPVHSSDARFLPFLGCGVPAATCLRLSPSPCTFVVNAGTCNYTPWKRSGFHQFPTRFLQQGLQACLCAYALMLCRLHHPMEDQFLTLRMRAREKFAPQVPETIKHRTSFCFSCLNPVLKYDLSSWKSYWLKLTSAEGRLI